MMFLQSARTNLLKHTAIAFGIAVYAAASVSPLLADDSEVFFAQADADSGESPNVLFVLDTSGSMNGDVSDGYTNTRLERMQDALVDILEESSNINVGLMRLNGFYGGGAVIYPMSSLNKTVCDAGGCGAISLTNRIRENNDDMEEFINTGEMTPTGNILSLGHWGNRTQNVGVRFQDINIPAGAKITSATIEFSAYGNSSGNASFSIRGHDVSDSPSISTDNYTLTNAPKTSATVNWQPGTWSRNSSYASPDLSEIVQEVTDRDDWCGGQSLGFIIDGSGYRNAWSYNGSRLVTNSANPYGNNEYAPVLRLSYDSSTIPVNEGCMRKVATAQVNQSSDDAFENARNRIRSGFNYIPASQTNTRSATKVTNRLRFQDLAIPQGAIIEQAHLTLKSYNDRSSDVSVEIAAENHATAPSLYSANGWIDSQPLMSGKVDWEISQADNWSYDTDVDTPDISSLVQQVVDRSDWQSSNDIAFQFTQGKNNKNDYRRFASYDHNPAMAAKLNVVYRANVGASDSAQAGYKTAREDMIQTIRDLRATGGTPVVSAYLEATNYLLGRPVDYGTSRGKGSQRSRYHRVSHPDSYSGGSVERYSSCTDNNPEDPYCVFENIQGDPRYVSPIASSCQSNHVVFLSDGAPTSNVAIDQVKTLIGESTCAVGSNGNETCGVELAKWLYDNDQVPNVPGKQNISTYTIGFNTKSDFLQRMATAGGGQYYEASSSQDLVEQFNNILSEVKAVDTSFVGPGATVNQFNRLTHRNDIYYALFKPSNRPLWDGNLKKYRAEVTDDGNVEIRDREGENVVDENTGYFSDASQSFWGTETDGNNVDIGGAAANISLSAPGGNAQRNVFTITGGIPLGGADLVSDASYSLHENNALISDDLLAITSGTSAERIEEREQLLQWARGVDVLDADVDGETNDVREQMGDPMHSRPVILNYANGDDSYTTIFTATNQGMLHAIEHTNGTELFAFMPEELLSNIKPSFDNQQGTNHPYGLDGDLSIWHDDINGNVVVDNDEKAYLFVGMRRGGRLYYAFDVSNRTEPKLLWKIEGGSGDFENLGQTWSKPIPTKIMHNAQVKQVLIFGGGYDSGNNDPNEDNLAALRENNKQPVDNTGNALYIVNAETGSLIWSAQADNSGSKVFNDMVYSIPANIRVLDINSDGLADQLYANDMGGQVWRFDFEPNHTLGDLLYGGVIARLNGDGIENSRRFYNEPDTALISENGKRFISVGIGSGWRAHPLHEKVEDRFYMIKQHSIFTRPEGYGKRVDTTAGATFEPFTERDLVDVTDNINPQTNENGWYLKMEGTGEKVLGTSLTLNNQFVFTTYEPADNIDPCSPALGSGNAYVVSVLDGSPTTKISNDDTQFKKEDRKIRLQHAGIPPAPNLLIVESDDNNGSGSRIGMEVLANLESLSINLGNLTQRTYWHDRERGNRSPTDISAEKQTDNDSTADIQTDSVPPPVINNASVSD